VKRRGVVPPTTARRERQAGSPQPITDAAVMRASYVDPDWSGHGLGSLLARVTEKMAMLAGHRRFEAVCTPMNEAMRRPLGYHVVRRVEVPLTRGVTLPMAHMRKELRGIVAPTR
jgi:GNAT superfamily N-acetyltransferase